MGLAAKLVVLVLALAVAAGAAAYHRAEVPSDSIVILDGVGAADRCLHAGVTSNCNAAGYGDVGYFPPLQYIPVFAMKRLAFSEATASYLLAAISGAALVLMLAVAWLVLARVGAPAMGPLFAGAVLASGLVWYATTTFGEALAALLTVCVVAAIVLRAPVAGVGVAAFAAGITKETAPPFVALLAIVCLLARGERNWGPAAGAVVIGLVTAIGANAGLNFFRYGHVWNDFYVPSSRPGAHLWPGIFAAMVASPNGGIIWFWGPLVALATLAAAHAWPSAAPLTRWPIALNCALLLGLVAFFTLWYAPFGWQAWGPRLLDPWLPALGLAALIAAAAAAEAIARRLVATTRGAALTFLVVAAFGLPQLAPYLDRKLPFRLFTDPCVNDVPHYYGCLSHLAWTAHPMLLRGYSALGCGGRPLLALAYLAGLGALVAVARRLSVRANPPPA